MYSHYTWDSKRSIEYILHTAWTFDYGFLNSSYFTVYRYFHKSNFFTPTPPLMWPYPQQEISRVL
jgi:hypothetical protein